MLNFSNDEPTKLEEKNILIRLQRLLKQQKTISSELARTLMQEAYSLDKIKIKTPKNLLPEVEYSSIELWTSELIINYPMCNRAFMSILKRKNGDRETYHFNEILDSELLRLSIRYMTTSTDRSYSRAFDANAYQDYQRTYSEKLMTSEYERHREKGSYEPYEIIYNTFSSQIREFNEKLPKDTVLFCLSAGCGDARDLEKIIEQNPTANITVAGFDLNENNIKTARTKLPQGHFEQGTLNNFSDHIRTLKLAAELPWNAKKIFIFASVLQHGICRGTYEATRHLQIAHREADVVFIASASATLTNRRILKAIGFYVQSNMIAHDAPSLTEKILHFPEGRANYFLTPQSDKERISYLIKRSLKRSQFDALKMLDLSFSGNPLKDFTLLTSYPTDYLADITQIDLSWSHMTSAEIKPLLYLMKQHLPNLYTTLISCTESWHIEFISSAKKYASSYRTFKRNDCEDQHSLPLISTSLARFFHPEALPIMKRPETKKINPQATETTTTSYIMTTLFSSLQASAYVDSIFSGPYQSEQAHSLLKTTPT